MPDVRYEYPELGKTVRPKGQGCTACIHQGYCVARYWVKRSNNAEILKDASLGVACGNWSNNIEDRLGSPCAESLKENEYLISQGLAEEASPSGLTDLGSSGRTEHEPAVPGAT